MKIYCFRVQKYCFFFIRANFLSKKCFFCLKIAVFYLKVSHLHYFSLQGCSTCLFYHHIHQLANLPSFTRKNHRLVLRSTSVHILATPLRITLHQYFYHLTDLLLITLQRSLILQRNDFVQAPNFLCFRYVVWQMLLRVSAWTLAVFEHKRRIKTHFAHQ